MNVFHGHEERERERTNSKPNKWKIATLSLVGILLILFFVPLSKADLSLGNYVIQLVLQSGQTQDPFMIKNATGSTLLKIDANSTLTINDASGNPSTLVGPRSGVEAASYIIFTDGTNVYAKNGTTGKIDFSGTDAATVIQSALNSLAASDRKGMIFIRKGNYIISSTLYLPASSSGYIIRGEQIGANDVSTGTTLTAEAALAGRVLIQLNNSIHSNNIRINDMTISSGGVALAELVNLSQSNSQSSRFVIENVMFYATSNMQPNSSLLNLDNNEDAVIYRSYFTPGSQNNISLKWHTPGGKAIIRDSDFGGILKIGNMDMLLEGVTIGAGGIHVDSCPTYPQLTLISLWIESEGAYHPFISNTCGAPLKIVAIGGRWNSQNSQPFINGSQTSPIDAVLDQITFNSNDASKTELIDQNATNVLVRYRSLYFIGGAAFSGWIRADNKGTATISNTNTVTFAHNLTYAPTFVSASFNSTNVQGWNWTANGQYLTINVNNTGNYIVYWKAEY